VTTPSEISYQTPSEIESTPSQSSAPTPRDGIEDSEVSDDIQDGLVPVDLSYSRPAHESPQPVQTADVFEYDWSMEFFDFELFGAHRGTGLMGNLPFFQVISAIKKPGTSHLAMFYDTLCF
jgi:hypothetical protein